MKCDKRVWGVTIILSILFGITSNGSAQLPGYENIYGPLVTPQEARQILMPTSAVRSVAATAQSQSQEVASSEMVSLVHGLKNDPDLIYAYVHDNIEYVPLFGDVKGALSTLTDKTGNDFDQASLMIAMLRQAGFTANYVYGTIRLDPDQVFSWLGTNHPGRLGSLMPSAGVPVQIWAYSADELAYLDVDHVWVKVTIDGTDYEFDPSLKTHLHHPGMDIKTITGFDRSAFVASALAGTTTGTPWIQNISKNNIQNNLSTMAMDLVSHIRTTQPDASLNQVIGGSDILKTTGVLRQSQLPYVQSTTAEWTDLPASFKTTLRVQHRGIDQTFFSSDIYGKRLTLFYNDANQPELRLDNSLLATGSAASPGSNQTISVDVNHPYAGNSGSYGDASGTINITAGGSFIIVNGWGEISQNMVNKHRRLLAKNKYAGGADTSEPILGQSLAMLSYLWLAECSRMDDLTEPLTKTEIIHHHWIGVSGQNQSPYIDMPINLASVISLGNDADMQRAVFVGSSGHHSAFEWGIVEQTQPSYSAVSTVKLIDNANANAKSDKIFEATNANFSTVKTLLKADTYSSGELGHIQSYINGGYRVILPEDGDLGEGAWQGTGFLTISPSANSVGHIISGGLKGGFGTEVWILGPDDILITSQPGPNSNSHEQSPEPIDLVSGTYLYDHTDLQIGSNPSPLGLSFSRSYNSMDRFSRGSLGLGWSHSFNIRADQMSSGFQAMGEDSTIDATAAILEIITSTAILSDSVSRDNLIIATIAHRWAMDMQIDNIILVSQPGTSQKFVKLADGSYNGSSDSADQMVVNVDNTLLMTKKHGSEMRFNVNGTIQSITDNNDNTVGFAYAENQLSQVSCDTGYGMSFTYSNQLLTRVDDTSL